MNNLKGVDLDIPLGQWVSFCGLSGSGKSSLAFDTLFAEGQRRYVESLSPHTRKHLHTLQKPVGDQLDGIPAAISVKATRGKSGRMATVGTTTDLSSLFGLLMTHLGQAKCPNCQLPIRRQNPQSVTEVLGRLAEGSRYLVVVPIFVASEESDRLGDVRRNGFSKVIIDGTTFDLNEVHSQQEVGTDSWIIVDRLVGGRSAVNRIRESLEVAFQFGNGQCSVISQHPLPESDNAEMECDSKRWFINSFQSRPICSRCKLELDDAEPRLFNFRNRLSACHDCRGTGFVNHSSETCSACGGSRFGIQARSYSVLGRSIVDWNRDSIHASLQYFENLELTEFDRRICEQLIQRVIEKLKYLNQVGLGYLQLERSIESLSTGEKQRVALTGCLGSTLVNMMYVIDEPAIGLHPEDRKSLVSAIRDLNDRQNTVVLVDHDPELVCAAERIVEIGPGAGSEGGEIVFDGTPEELLDGDTLSGQYFSRKRGFVPDEKNRRQPRGSLKITGARGNNLKRMSVEFPLGCLCVVTGVSGAGKSSLVLDTLYPAICQRKNLKSEPPLPFDDIFGDSQFDEVVLVDQTPLGRSSRSNPVTYVKAFDDIRRTFAETADAKTHNIKVSDFSFNSSGGRCDKCEGEGQLQIEMQFLPDMYLPCDQCRGTRYREEILAVRYRGINIAEALAMTVADAFRFFRGQPKVQARLKSLLDVGLGYLQLGQPANTLSAGESQRLKLGYYLSTAKSKRVLFLMDEPTSGLHMGDIVRLADCFDTLLAVGHSMILIEHNLQMISYADWVVDLGPGPSEQGGEIVVVGTPEKVAACKQSISGKHLNHYFDSFN
ncbi:MAG: excinuclease ABC subunit UvrA [Planctomycetota bacterium]